MLRMVVLVSGGGTNLGAIFDAMDSGKIKNAEVAAVISNNPAAFALERAKARNVDAVTVNPKTFETRDLFNEALLATIDKYAPDLIVLAGCLVNIPASIIKKYKNRIINIHPSLIPSFGGQGYYGLKVHEAALAKGVKVTGATVHFVDEGIDTGKILSQRAVYVAEGDDAKSLQKRVMEQAEWLILPDVISKISAGLIKIGEE